MKSKRKRGVMPLNQGSSEILSDLLSQSLIRLSPYVDSALIARLGGYLRSRNWVGLLGAIESVPITVYSGVESFYTWTQFVSLVKKYPFVPSETPGFDPEAAAWKKFLAAEHSCKRVNQRFIAWRKRKARRPYVSLIHSMRRYIERVIGPSPDLLEIYDKCDFGPGASVGVSGDFTNFARKFLAEKWSVSPTTLSYAIPALWRHEQLRNLILGDGIVCLDYEEFRSRVMARCALVSHNNISFVPKTFKTYRSIASEPLLNGYLQKGIDLFFRKRLLQVGIDLSDQSANAEKARVGSMGGFNPYCTIDLSSASDSLSRELVKELLPEDWFDLLDRTRSRFYKYKGKVYPYHKFVSMGNGFCFPLQTLIFAAACHAVCSQAESPDDFLVYGDDIVVRQSEGLVVLELLRYIGFRNNPDKTFLTGPFRESCGSDWYGGLDVRPVYLDFRFLENRDLYKFHNSTLRGPLTYPHFVESREFVRRICPCDVRFVRPYHGPPDTAFTVPEDISMSSKFVHWDRNLQNWRWKEVISTSVRDRLWEHDPSVCNRLEYLAVLRGSTSSVPLAIRRKTKTSVRSRSYWGVTGSEPCRPEEPIPAVRPE